jgi:hypothetical protein
MEDIELLKAINESGFPLQMGVQRLALTRDWQVVLSEHAWRDPLSGDEKFIDLVVRRMGGPERLVVECKRARDTEWLFLRHSHQYQPDELNVRSRLAARNPTKGGLFDEWLDLNFVPGSPEAAYCVIRKNGQRSQEMLERTAAEVVRATDALALQEININVKNGGRLFGRAYVPMIVTTARMFVCDVDYDQVEPQTGEVASATIITTPIIRFKKSLSAPDLARSSAVSVEEFAAQSERSVVVVQAAAFSEFLKNWGISRRMPTQLSSALFVGD